MTNRKERPPLSPPTARRRPRKAHTVKVGKTGESAKSCFIIAPFGGWNDAYYEEIYRPAVELAGLSPKRADDLYRPSAIVHDIWAFVKSSQVILADLTDKNPNVFYELGLSHALGKPVVMVTQSMDDVPFDLRALRVIQFAVEDPEWAKSLRERIKRALKEVLAAPEQAVPPTFLHERRTEGQPTVTPLEKKVLQLEQQFAVLREESISRPRRPQIQPREALDLIERYVSRELPSRVIVERLEDLGVPRDWTLGEIRKLKPQPARPSPVPPAVPPKADAKSEGPG